jgi:hypothetical protein
MALFKNKKHWKHFIYAIPIGFVLTILQVLIVAANLEFKNEAWGKDWDWSDWTCTMLGGLIGQVFQVIFILCIC